MLYIHFLDHQHRQADISFADFLSMHYWGDDIDDNDAEEDRKLPFKGTISHSTGDIFIAQKLIAVVLSRPFKEEKKYILPDDASLPQNAHSALFRPPQPLI